MRSIGRAGLAALLLIAPLLAARASAPPPAESGSPEAPADDGGRIVNGNPADWDTAPWQLKLTWKDPQNEWTCGAVLIARDWVLTARHCVLVVNEVFDELDAKAALTLTAGHLDYDPGQAPTAQRRRVDKVVVAPGWRVTESKFKVADLALVRLEAPFKPERRADGTLSPIPVTLPPPDPLFPSGGAGQTGRIAGWGSVQAVATGKGAGNAQRLQYADLPILTPAQCRVQATKNGLSEVAPFVCAWNQRSDDFTRNVVTCSGDSGGGLVMIGGGQRILAGIVSGAVGCGPRAAVFTRVSLYTGWIKSQMDAQ